MKAMILAAGRGTRFGPLTARFPKALITLGGKSLLEHALEKLSSAGVTEVIINVHHEAGQVLSFLRHHRSGMKRIEVSDERNELLDTGGGLLKASRFFGRNEDFYLYNVDIYSDIDLVSMLQAHKRSAALVTLAVRQRQSSRQLLFTPGMELTGWVNHATGEKILAGQPTDLREYAFSGIHVINSSLFKEIAETGCFPIIPVYIRLSANKRILGYTHDESSWFDVGSPGELQEAEDWLKNKMNTE